MRRPTRQSSRPSDRLLYRRGNFGGTVDQLICDALLGEFDAEIALSPGFRWGNSVLPGQPVTMEDVLTETAMTYPETYVLNMTGGQIKDVLEDVCDNLFNADPYYQQGGDMVRVGGLAYTCAPTESVGRRISDLKLGNGKSARSRQELQGGGMGLRQRAAGRAGVGRVRQASARRKDAGPARHRRHLEEASTTIRASRDRDDECSEHIGDRPFASSAAP